MARKKDLILKAYSDIRGMWRWRVAAGNGEQLARSPRGYRKKREMMAHLDWIVEQEHDPEVYRDGRGEYRWRLSDEQGVIVAIGSEGYRRRIDCDEAANLFLDAVPV